MTDLTTLAIAFVCAAAHLISTEAARLIRDHHRFESFAGGLAVSYVFLHLLPELNAGDEILGRRIYFVALLGFLVVYGVEHRLRRADSADAQAIRYRLHMTVSAIYTALIVFTLSSQLPHTVFLTALFAVAIGLHLAASGIGALEQFGERFSNQGRYILAAAAAAGYLLSLIRRPREEAIDTLTAVLAGFMLFTVFQNELPDTARARFVPFLVGIATFGLLHFATP